METKLPRLPSEIIHLILTLLPRPLTNYINIILVCKSFLAQWKALGIYINAEYEGYILSRVFAADCKLSLIKLHIPAVGTNMGSYHREGRKWLDLNMTLSECNIRENVCSLWCQYLMLVMLCAGSINAMVTC